MIGDCDCCNRQSVPLSNVVALGIDTSACFICQGDTDPDTYGELLPRCTNPEIDDYPPWLLQATKDALGEFVEGPELGDARLVLKAIDEAVRRRSSSLSSPHLGTP